MSELLKFQKDVGEWGNKTFNPKRKVQDKYSHISAVYNHLVREVEELRMAIVQAMKCLGTPAISSIGQEAADCLIILLHIAHQEGFDLLEEAEKKMEINRKRPWGEPDEDGVIEHEKPPIDLDGDDL